MTNEYKQILINYLTGLLNQQQPLPSDDAFTNIKGIEYSSSSWQFVIDAFSNEYKAVINGILENENYDKFIMYGAYQSADTEDTKGFLIYLNNNGLPYKVMKLNSRGILYLDLDEETNRIYGVISNASVYVSGVSDVEVYFAYYNNLFLTDDEGIPIHQSYAYKIDTIVRKINKIVKDPDGANYLIVSSAYSGIGKVIVYELKINVGTPTELNIWNVDEDYRGFSAYASYSSSNPNFKLIAYNPILDIWKVVTNNGANLDYTDISITGNVDMYFQLYIHMDDLFVNENEMYFIYPEYRADANFDYYRTALIKYNGSNLEVIYETPEGTVPTGDPIFDFPYLNICKDIDNTLYLLEYISDLVNNKTQVNICNITANPSIDLMLPLYTGSYISFPNILNQRALLRRNFNIANIFSFSGYFKENSGLISGNTNGFQLNVKDLRPIGKYVGDPYISVDALVPEYVDLLSNNELVFSRNLYNISIQNNMTTSSVEIPNNYLNDIMINYNELIGKTNFMLNWNSDNWDKNIYEVVDLNFLNTINIKDEDTNTNYPLGATKLNTSVTNGGNTNYTNSPCLKYRINYSDETSSVNNLTWVSLNKTNKKCKFTITVNKAINNIELISYDETTVYMQIVEQFDVGKTYTINQKVRIGAKAQPSQLLYNNQAVLYNNNDIMVYIEEE